MTDRPRNDLEIHALSGILQFVRYCTSIFSPRLISCEAIENMEHANHTVAGGQRQAAVYKAKLSDIAPVFNLVQECCESGYLNNIYLFPPYLTGLAIQLFSVWLFGKIYLPTGTWHKATLYVIRHEGKFAGFILMRHLEPSGASQEIYVCAVEAKYRGKGFGKLLIQSALKNTENNTLVEAECLPKAVAMKRLLRHLGFESINHTKATTSKNIAEKFRVSCNFKSL